MGGRNSLPLSLGDHCTNTSSNPLCESHPTKTSPRANQVGKLEPLKQLKLRNSTPKKSVQKRRSNSHHKPAESIRHRHTLGGETAPIWSCCLCYTDLIRSSLGSGGTIQSSKLSVWFARHPTSTSSNQRRHRCRQRCSRPRRSHPLADGLPRSTDRRRRWIPS
jgi:hypothetical protein